MNAEQQRLTEDRDGVRSWRAFGPYLSERQWGTVREDYSEHGEAWEYLSHDASRSRAYRWGEDGIAGFCNDNSDCASQSHFGTGKTRSSKSGCSAWRETKAITARTSKRSTIS